ncbi:hypothetical protein [Xanthomonas translucens]|nr:hypothetical protein [Xanthomonas translucens]
MSRSACAQTLRDLQREGLVAHALLPLVAPVRRARPAQRGG